MKRKLTTAYAVGLLILLLGAMVAVAAFAFSEIDTLVKAFVGLALAFVLAPVCHELGHLVFAIAGGMRVKYLKCFCFRYTREKGKGKLSLCSPFSADETQVTPLSEKNMKKRVIAYTVGGLAFSFAFLLAILIAVIIAAVAARPNFFLLGMLPYTAYLFLLNAAPLEYPSDKTDALILQGLIRGEDTEKVFLATMEIYGALCEGKGFGDLEKEKLFSLPQLAEDEPLHAVTLDLKYRYALAVKDFALAEDCLKRLLVSEEYLTDGAYENLKIELVYFSLLLGKDEPLKKLQETDEAFLRSDDYRAKRILALYSAISGGKEQAEALIAQGLSLVEREEIVGVKLLEKTLFERIKECL
jgi:hypothetical protein